MQHELYKNPTVKEVDFEIRFSNLFYIEKFIPDFQLAILERFPESSLLMQQEIKIGFVDSINNQQVKQPESGSQKIWQFKSPDGYQLNISSNNLSISSVKHKTYNNPDEPIRLRDTIAFITNTFFDLIKIPVLTRVGLRYIDECPIFKLTMEDVTRFYNSYISFEKFPIEKSLGFEFRTLINFDEYFVTHTEILTQKAEPPNEYMIVLDLDAYSNNVKADELMETLDKFHQILHNEYENFITDEMRAHMRS